jgi:hypothetical protein
MRIEIPAGALSEATALAIEPDTSAPAGALAGTTFALLPHGALFAKPVRVAISYDPASLPSGIEPADLCVAKVVDDEWVIQGCDVESDAYTVSAETTSFSIWGIVADKLNTPDDQQGQQDGTPSSPGLAYVTTTDASTPESAAANGVSSADESNGEQDAAISLTGACSVGAPASSFWPLSLLALLGLILLRKPRARRC